MRLLAVKRVRWPGRPDTGWLLVGESIDDSSDWVVLSEHATAEAAGEAMRDSRAANRAIEPGRARR